MRLIGMQHEGSPRHAVRHAAAIVEALDTRQRAADGIGCMPVHIVAMTTKERFDAFHVPHGRRPLHPVVLARKRNSDPLCHFRLPYFLCPRRKKPVEDDARERRQGLVKTPHQLGTCDPARGGSVRRSRAARLRLKTLGVARGQSGIGFSFWHRSKEENGPAVQLTAANGASPAGGGGAWPTGKRAPMLPRDATRPEASTHKKTHGTHVPWAVAIH